MATPMSDECKTLLRLLSDGKTYPLEEVYDRLAATVPPGKALRKYEEKAANWEKHNGPRKGPELSDEQKIRSGQRTMARVAVRSMRVRYVQMEETPNGATICLRPEAAELPQMPPLKMRDNEPAADEKREIDEPEIAKVENPEPVVDLTPESRSEPETTPLPACVACGLYVVNAAQHEEWHAHQPPPPPDALEQPQTACAFFSEDQVRLLLRQELDAALGRFQQGMQSWLIHRFAALEAQIQGINRPREPFDERKSRRVRW